MEWNNGGYVHSREYKNNRKVRKRNKDGRSPDCCEHAYTYVMHKRCAPTHPLNVMPLMGTLVREQADVVQLLDEGEVW